MDFSAEEGCYTKCKKSGKSYTKTMHTVSLVVLYLLESRIGLQLIVVGLKDFFSNPSFVFDLVVVTVALIFESIDSAAAGMVIFIFSWRLLRLIHALHSYVHYQADFTKRELTRQKYTLEEHFASIMPQLRAPQFNRHEASERRPSLTAGLTTAVPIQTGKMDPCYDPRDIDPTLNSLGGSIDLESLQAVTIGQRTGSPGRSRSPRSAAQRGRLSLNRGVRAMRTRALSSTWSNAHSVMLAPDSVTGK
eukprot:4277270-Prymnesium_polylepis.1